MNIQNLISIAMLNSAQNQQQRQEAEQSIYTLKTTQPSELLSSLATELANENSQISLRQAAGTLFTRIITQGNIQQSDWNRLSVEIKSTIKQNLLSTLISQHMEAKRAAANAISGICAIELPQNQWPEIIQVLCSNTTHQDIEIKKSAILTLGYILEQLKLVNQQKCLTEQQIESILTSILINLDKNQALNEEIQIIAAQGLLNSIQFLEKHLEKLDIRNYIINLLINTCTQPNPKIQIPCLQVLIEFCRIQYHNLANYITPFFNYLNQLMLNDNSEIAIPATEIWNTIATTQKEQIDLVGRKQDNQAISYIETCANNLIPILLTNLEKQPDLDEGELNIQECSSRCLCSVLEIMQNNDDSLQLLINFISQNINSQPQQKRQAAAIAFGAMIEGGNKEKITPLLMNALPSIIALLQDEKIKVRKAVAQTLAKVAEFNPEVIANQQQLLEHLKIYSIALQSVPAISRQMAWLFNYLADYLPVLDGNHELHKQIENVINILSSNTLRENIEQKDYNLIDICYMAIINWIHQANNQIIAKKCLIVYLEEFKNKLTVNTPKWQHHISGMLSIIHSSLLRLLGNVESELAGTTFQLIISYFQLINDVNTDGLFVFSSLASATKEYYIPHLEMTYNYLKHALSKTNEPDIFKSAISVLGDVARAVEEKFSQYLPEIIPALLNCLNLQDFNREIKSQVFVCLGDLFLACKFSIGAYLENILGIFDLALIACVQMQQQESAESQEYAEQLKEKLVESYICIVHALEKPEDTQMLEKHFPKMIDFIQKTCAKEINPTIVNIILLIVSQDYIRQCLTLMTDIANFYGKAVANLVKTQFTQDIINTLNKFNYIKENKEIIEYALQVEFFGNQNYFQILRKI